MKTTRIIFWIVTILMAVLISIGAVFDLIKAPEAIKEMTRIGYPEYLLPFLGVAKLLGIFAIVFPGFPKIKEWAYAGMVFELTGATYSHIASGDAPLDWIGPIIGIALVVTSYILYHKLQRGTVESAL